MRRTYEEVGYNGEVPPGLPRQLMVSQRVTARHPVTRQLHDGDVLTIAPNCYRSPPRACPAVLDPIQTLDNMSLPSLTACRWPLLCIHAAVTY